MNCWSITWNRPNDFCFREIQVTTLVSPFPKTFHVDVITTLPTLQTSLSFLLDMCVPLLQLLHDLWRALNVLWIWFALPHLFRSLRNPKVLPTVDGSPKVPESTKQTRFCVTLLRETLVRESTSQEIITLQFWYWCMVVLCPEWHRSGDLHCIWWRHLSCFPPFFGDPGFIFW